MTKKNMVKEYVEEFEDDFDYADEAPENDMIADMMNGLVEASNHQAMMAIELTKLIVSKNIDPNLSGEKILDIYKKALQTIAEHSPLKSILEKA